MLEQRIIVGFTSGCGEYSATHHHLPATMFAAIPSGQACGLCTGQIHRRTWLSQRQSPPGRRQHAASFGEIADKVNLPLHRPPIGTRADRHWMKRRNGPPHLRQFGREGLIMFHPTGWSKFAACRKWNLGGELVRVSPSLTPHATERGTRKRNGITRHTAPACGRGNEACEFIRSPQRGGR